MATQKYQKPVKKHLQAKHVPWLTFAALSAVAFWGLLTYWIFAARSQNATNLRLDFNVVNEMGAEVVIFPIFLLIAIIACVQIFTFMFKRGN
jgi:ABC-type transport system involved in cytochrome c biogenesis permease subunit